MKNFGKKLFGRLGLFFALASVMVIVSCDDDPTPVVAAFTAEVDGLAVTVSNTSTGASTYAWDFGDGSDVLDIVDGTYTYAA